MMGYTNTSENKTMTIKAAQGVKTFEKSSRSKNLTIVKNGKIALAKDAPKRSYNIKVTAAGNDNYKKGSKTVAIKITIK